MGVSLGPVATTLAFFSKYLTLGLISHIFVVNPHFTGNGFPRVIAGIAIAFGGLALLIHGVHYSSEIFSFWDLWGMTLVSALLYIGIKEKQNSALLILCWANIIGTLFFELYHLSSFRILYTLGTVGLLGTTMYAMCLGHYYLVVPKLSEQHLKKTFFIFWPLLFFKIGLSAWAYWEGSALFSSYSTLGEGYLLNWVYLSMRYLWGYLALGVLSFFAYRLCVMRSIQSATGILYVMVFFVLPAELVSLYFGFAHGVFL